MIQRPTGHTPHTVPGYAFGYGNRGALGVGSTASASKPVPTTFPHNTIRLVGGRGFSLALTASGDLFAWGDNRRGQLGNRTGQSSLRTQVAVKVPGGRRIVAVDAADDHAVAVSEHGLVYVWGGNSRGELGVGDRTDQAVPVSIKLPRGERAVGVAAGTDHLLILTATGHVYGCGDNVHGQLGPGHGNVVTQPVRVQLPRGSRPALAVSAGGSHSVVLTGDGSVLTLGHMSGTVLSSASGVGQAAPPFNSPVVAIDTGLGHTLALTRAGRVFAWGDNSEGQLGTDAPTDHLVPQPVAIPRRVTAISTGGGHAVALDSAGRVWTWGANGYGQNGHGHLTPSSTPQPVASLSGIKVKAVAAADFHTLVLAG